MTGQWSPETPLAELFYTYLLNCPFNWWTQIQQILTSPNPNRGGGGCIPPQQTAGAAVLLRGGPTDNCQLLHIFRIKFWKMKRLSSLQLHQPATSPSLVAGDGDIPSVLQPPLANQQSQEAGRKAKIPLAQEQDAILGIEPEVVHSRQDSIISICQLKNSENKIWLKKRKRRLR